MLEITLILILAVVAMVAIIVNRKSLLACIVITAVSSLLGLGFLVLYANADKFSSHAKLLSFTITASVVVIIALLVVTYIGVKMHFKKLFTIKKYVPEEPQEAVGEPMLIPGTTVYAKAVGIFGRRELAETGTAATTQTKASQTHEPQTVQPQTQTAQTQTVQPQTQTAQTQAEKPKDDMLVRMLMKAESFKEKGQYVLAEQMYVTYIARCPDNSSRADGELLMLDCRILAGNTDGAKQQLADLINKLRSGEYQLTQEQKKMLADCKMRLMKM